MPMGIPTGGKGEHGARLNKLNRDEVKWEMPFVAYLTHLTYLTHQSIYLKKAGRAFTRAGRNHRLLVRIASGQHG
jgi:hypothetical protein